MNEQERKAKKLAEKYWRTVDYRTMTVHGHVVKAFVEGYKVAKGEMN